MFLVRTCMGASRNDVTKIMIFFDTIVTHLSKILNTPFPLRPWRHLWTIPNLNNYQIRHMGSTSPTFYAQLLHAHNTQKRKNSFTSFMSFCAFGIWGALELPVNMLWNDTCLLFFIFISCWVCYFRIGSASDWSSERQTRCFKRTVHCPLVLESRYTSRPPVLFSETQINFFWMIKIVF